MSSLDLDPARPDAAGPAPLASTLHETALASGFHGVIRLDAGDQVVLDQVYGLADRAHGIALTTAHRVGLASIAKGFTALAVGSLIDEGALTLEESVRPVLGGDLPLIDDAVTVGHLLAHTSGIGDYLDED